MAKRPILQILTALTAMGMCGGCAAVLVGGGLAAGAGAITYVRGDLEMTVDHRIELVYRAAQQSLDDLEIKTIEAEKDALSARLVGRGSENKKVTIKIASTQGYRSQLSVRVGTFGDQTMSQIIWDRIQENLKIVG